MPAMVVSVIPRGDCRDAPGSECCPVVPEIHSIDRIALIEVSGANRMRIVPAVPVSACSELISFPSEILLLLFTDLTGWSAEELCVPFGYAELPRHHRAPESSTTLIPTPIHHPVPGHRHSIFASEERFDTFNRPVLEPVGHFLNRDEVGVEVDRVHRTEIARGVVVDDTARVEAFDNRLRAESTLDIPRRPG